MATVNRQYNAILARLIRLRDAPFYLGMDRNRFAREVRPYLTKIPVGKQGIAFDRLELDAWVEQYKSRNGCPAEPNGEISWQERRHLASSDEAEFGISTKRPTEDRLQGSIGKCDLEEAEAVLSHAYGQNGKAFPTLSGEACTIIPLNQWANLVEILVRESIPGRLEVPCFTELQDID
jgi:hypothetical protein